MLCAVSGDEEKGAAEIWGKRKRATDSDSGVVDFHFCPDAYRAAKSGAALTQGLLLCAEVAKSTQRAETCPVEERRPLSPFLFIHVFFPFYFFPLFPSKWGYSFAPSMSAAALALDEPKALWTLPNGRRKKKRKSKLLSLTDSLIRPLALWMSRREAFLSDAQRVMQSQGGY